VSIEEKVPKLAQIQSGKNSSSDENRPCLTTNRSVPNLREKMSVSGSTAEQTVEQYNARSLKTFWETTIAKKKEESTTNIHIPKLASRGLLRRNKKPDLIQEENLRLQEMVGELSHQLFDQNRVIEEQQKEIEKLRAQLQAQS